jgi:hypothetical protein
MRLGHSAVRPEGPAFNNSRVRQGAVPRLLIPGGPKDRHFLVLFCVNVSRTNINQVPALRASNNN